MTSVFQEEPDYELEYYRALLLNKTKYSTERLKKHLVANGAYPQVINSLNRDQLIALILNPDESLNKRYFQWGRGLGANYGLDGLGDIFGHEGAGIDGEPTLGTGLSDGDGLCSGLNTHDIETAFPVMAARGDALKRALTYNIVKHGAAKIKRDEENKYKLYKNADALWEDIALGKARAPSASGGFGTTSYAPFDDPVLKNVIARGGFPA